MFKKRSSDFSSVSFVSLILFSLTVVLLDQVTKFLALKFLTPGVSRPLIRGIFHLTLTYNKGAAFGLFKNGGLFFIFASIVCITAMILLAKKRDRFLKVFALDPRDRIVHFAFALILGGACGNLIDRLRFFSVVDFLDFRIWPVFNVADSAITIGAILFFFKFVKKTKNS